MKLNIRLVLLTVVGWALLFAGDGRTQPPPPTSECPASIGSIAECPNTGCGKDEGQGENTQDAAHTDLSFSSLFAPTPRDIRGA